MTDMIFTKTERRILSPNHAKWERLMLWMGIICLCLSIAFALYFSNQINKLKDARAAMRQTAEQNIEPTTKQEEELKSMLLETIAENNDLLSKYLFEKIFSGVFFIFTMGIFLIVSYFRSRVHTRLIHKLLNSQQQNRGDRE